MKNYQYVVKYLKKGHLQQFKEKGRIRVGTFQGYRNTENSLIKDLDEGSTTYIIELNEDDEPITLPPEILNTMTNEYIIKGSITFKGPLNFKMKNKVQNAFIYSTSKIYEPVIMKKFGYDSYFKITNIKNFQTIIQKELQKSNKFDFFSRINQVIYEGNKTIKITNKNKEKVLRKMKIKDLNDFNKPFYGKDYFTKLVKFTPEQEFRFVFIPCIEPPEFLPKNNVRLKFDTNMEIKPIFIENKKLVSCCQFPM